MVPFKLCPLGRRAVSPVWRSRAFSLIELLTVVFIISLLIGILIPSLTSARNAAKKTTSKAVLNTLKVALEAFKNENERDFRATNGYPPSFSHPPIGDFTQTDSLAGRFPFLSGKPVVYGAHWLPAMLIGADGQGFVQRSSVPQTAAPDLRSQPHRWYNPTPEDAKRIERSQLYLDPAGLKLVRTRDLPGFRNEALFPNWGNDQNPPDDSTMWQLPVIVDSFGQTILYYAANAFGKPTNLVECERNEQNRYDQGPPYYFHEDNAGFTGDGDSNNIRPGWSFGGSNEHWIARCGNLATPMDIETLHDGKTFARYILDRNAFAGLVNPTVNSPMRPVNADSYLLISPGVDGLYGTRDDVTNFPTGAE